MVREEDQNPDIDLQTPPPMSKFPAGELSGSGPNDQRPSSSDSGHPTRRLRTRQSARVEASKQSPSRLGSSTSLKPESARSHADSIARIRSSTMSRLHHGLDSFSLGPKLTKTGRISKAKKGVKDAHICSQCGKVSFSTLWPCHLALRISLIHLFSHVYCFVVPSSLPLPSLTTPLSPFLGSCTNYAV